MRYRYRPYSYERGKRPLFLKLIRRLAVLSLLFLSFYALFLSLGGRPQLEGVESLRFIPAEGEYNLKVKNGKIKSARLYVEQEGKNYKVFEGNFPEGTDFLKISINTKALGIKEGDAKVKLWVSSGFLREREYTIDAKVDLTPPSLEILSYPTSLREGSVGVLRVKSNGAEVYLEWNGKKASMIPVSPDGKLIAYKGNISEEHAAMAAMMCAANTLMAEMQTQGYTALSGQEWTPLIGWALTGPKYSVCVIGNVGVFVNNDEVSFNEIFKVLREVAGK